MSHPSPAHDHETEHFSLWLFAFTVAASLAGLLLGLKLLAPPVWTAQFSASTGHFLAAFAAVSLFNCFVEYFFHRYVLHKPAIPGLGRFYKQHTHHHNLTRITRRRTPGGRDVPYVENRFPITEPEQGEASFFPWYTLAVFAGLLTPMFAVLHVFFPSFPWFIAGYAALTSSLVLYEVLHAIEHWSFEKWGPLIEHPRWGWFWRKAYSFHLRHHAVIDCNEGISGFFGLPIADWVFGTCIIPKTLYADGETAESPTAFESPRPRAFIRWCDVMADRLVRYRRAQAQAPAESAAIPADGARKYTRGEEFAHVLTHALGLVASAVGLALLIVFSSLRGNAWHVVSFTVFGLTLLLLYTASTLYHSATAARWKRLFRKFDHAAIFLLIAGTYTPFLLVSLRGPLGWTLFGIVWGLCGLGALAQLFIAGQRRLATTVVCLIAGWLVILALHPLKLAVPNGGLWLLVGGGLFYTVGTVFYLWRRLRYHHAVWHTFVLGGSTCHFLAVFLFLLPAHSSI